MKLCVYPSFVFMAHDTINERTVCLVKLSQLHDHLSYLIRVSVQEMFCKGWTPGFCLRKVYAQLFKDLGNRCIRPGFNVYACLTFDLGFIISHLGA